MQPALRDTTLPSLEPSTSQTMPKIIMTEFSFFLWQENDIHVRICLLDKYRHVRQYRTRCSYVTVVSTSDADRPSLIGNGTLGSASVNRIQFRGSQRKQKYVKNLRFCISYNQKVKKLSKS
jgi:hypothetical protein